MTRSSRSTKHAVWPTPSPRRPAGSRSPDARHTDVVDRAAKSLLDRIAAFLDEAVATAVRCEPSE